jgi:hypothetical protein
MNDEVTVEMIIKKNGIIMMPKSHREDQYYDACKL